MATALTQQREIPEGQRLSFEERVGLLVDRELTPQENRRLVRRRAQARLQLNATREDLDYRPPRGLDKGLLATLATGQWIRSHDHVLITGPGKTYLACARGHMACRLGCFTLYLRLPRFFRDRAVAKGDGRYGRRLRNLAKTDLVLLDDWGLAPLTEAYRRDLLEVLDDRHGRRATVVASHVPVEPWHTAIGEPTLADAILDRLVHKPIRSRSKETRCESGWLNWMEAGHLSQQREALRRVAPTGGGIRSESVAGFGGIRTTGHRHSGGHIASRTSINMAPWMEGR